MKKLIFLFVSILVVVSLSASRCADVHGNMKKADEPSWHMIHFVWADSVVDGEAKNLVGFDCMLPCGKGAGLVDSVLAWVLPQLGDSAAVARFMAEGQTDSTRLNTLLGELGGMKIEEGNQTLKDEDISVWSRSSEQTCRVRVAYEDSVCVSYVVESYFYGGGAHGNFIVMGATFAKADGHRMGYNELLPDRTETDIRKETVAGLMQYFECTTEAELKDNLLLDFYEPADSHKPLYEAIPLPVGRPWLEKDGVHIVYQQYEIACYAAGMPAVVLLPSRRI